MDVGTGNLMVTTRDRSLTTINGQVQFGLMWNSAAVGSGLPTGAAGTGWHTPFGEDHRIASNSDGSILYLARDGRQALLRPNNSGQYSAAEFKMSLARIDGVWVMTEHASRTRTYFNSAGRPERSVERNGLATTFRYTSGHVSSIQTPTGDKLTFTHVGGRIATATRVASDTRPASTVRYGYDSSGRLTSVTRPGRLGGGESTARFTYTTSGQLSTITTAAGLVTKFAYSGDAVTRVDRGGAVTRIEYGNFSETKVAPPVSDLSKPVAETVHATYGLDASDRVTSARDTLGRSRSRTYTPHSDVASDTNGLGGTTKASYGANDGQSLTSVTSPGGASRSWSYGSGGNSHQPTGSKDSQGNSSVMTYSGTGNPTSTANAEGATAKVDYNADGTIKTSTDPEGRVTTYTQTAAKYIGKITPPAGSGLGAITIKGNPAVSVTDGRGVMTTYVRDDRDNVVSQTVAGHQVQFTYDDDGRLLQRKGPNQTLAFTYDARGNVLERTATPNTSSAPAASRIVYTYDAADQVRTKTVDGVRFEYLHYSNGDLAAVTNPDKSVTRFRYDKNGRRTDTFWRTNADNSSYAAHSHNDMDSSGRITRSWTATNSDDSKRVIDRSYCYTKYIAGRQCPTGSTRNDTGLIQYSVDHLAGSTSRFTYDKGNRLTGVTGWNGHSYAYTYDRNGNRLTRTVDGKRTQTLTFDAGNKITSSGYGYDQAGNRTQDPAQGAVTWNGAGQATTWKKDSAAALQFTYSGTGMDELVRQSDGTTTLDYNWGNQNQAGVPTWESYRVNAGGTATVENDSAGQPLAVRNGNTPVAYLAYDGLGRLAAMVRPDGSVSSRYTTDPYGHLQQVTDAAGSPSKPPAVQTMNSAAATNPWTTIGVPALVAGYWKRGTRWNDTLTGTWTSVDPLTFLNDPSRANPYHYAGNDPINLTDPTGRDWGDVWDTVSSVASSAGGCLQYGGAAMEAGMAIGAAYAGVGAVGGGTAGFLIGCGVGIIAEQAGPGTQ